MKQYTGLIEFFGMPGVGKSTISSEIAKVITQEGISVEQRMYSLSHHVCRTKRIIIKSFYVLKGILLNPKYTVLSAKIILATKQRSNLDLLKVLFNWLFVSSLLRQSKLLKRICLFDEGIFQAMWSIGFSADEPDAIISLAKQLTSLIPLPDIVIVVEADLSIIKHRLSTRLRHDSRLEQLPDDSEDLLEYSILLFEKIKLILQSFSEHYHGIHILMLKNEQSRDVRTNIARVIEAIESIFAETTSAKISNLGA